jgi:SOUL heme-binding protein
MPESTKGPTYSVVHDYGVFELREYGPSVCAETTVEGDFQGGWAEGFTRLEGYLLGANSEGAAIALSAPIAQQGEGREGGEGGEGRAQARPYVGGRRPWRLWCSLPRAGSVETMPRPRDERVRLRPAKRARFAALSCVGPMPSWQIERKVGELLAKLAEHGLSPAGEPLVTRFGTPVIASTLERSEVLVPIELANAAELGPGGGPFPQGPHQSISCSTGRPSTCSVSTSLSPSSRTVCSGAASAR